jgi:hypothetical protein
LVTPHEGNQDLTAEFDGGVRVRHLIDAQHGKPAALNLALGATSAEIVVMTDGDVRVEHNAIRLLLAAFDDPLVGAATGRPVPMVSRGNAMFATWARALLHEAHQLRQRASDHGDPVECSGYLYAIRRSLLTQFPEDVLAEDAYASGVVLNQKYRVAYVPAAIVWVRPPSSLRDWFRQKIRSLVGSQQLYLRSLPRMRTFQTEVRGVTSVLRHARRPRDVPSLLLLAGARLVAWLVAAREARGSIRYARYWRPISSTKARTPQVGDVYCVADASLPVIGGAECRPCVVLSVHAGGLVRVVPRGPWSDHPNVVASTTEGLPFDGPGAFVRYALPVAESDLGDFRGRCPSADLHRLLEAFG